MENKNDDSQMIENIIQRWMENYPPADDEDMFTLKLTSYEVAEILSDFAAVTPGDVTRELLKRSYRLARTGEGEMKWLIKKGINK